MANQAIKWSPLRQPWPDALRNHARLRADLEREVAEHDGIRREFVFGQAECDPIELFLAAMAWGFGTTNVRWPRQALMLIRVDDRAKLTEILRTVRQKGAAEGWSALWGDQHVDGLGAAFGTKLLYFRTKGARGVTRTAERSRHRKRVTSSAMPWPERQVQDLAPRRCSRARGEPGRPLPGHHERRPQPDEVATVPAPHRRGHAILLLRPMSTRILRTG